MGDKNVLESAGAGDHKSQPISENMRLQGGDHPGMSLVSVPLDGNNYFPWVRSIKFALGAKQKLGFIDGSCPKPTDDKNEIEQWQRTDCMVVSWILNSISKDIAEAFLYATSARDLWLDLESRFGESNGPLLYQIQREIVSMTQGNMSVAVYFTKLKKLWDELASLDPTPSCSCGAGKKISEKTASNQLLQFLMGLSDAYDHVRSQVLLMDPLPTVGKTYSMILRVEKQREVYSGIPGEGVMATQFGEVTRQVPNKGPGKKRGFMDKKQLYCQHCKKSGHLRENCFELTGFPDWYRDLVEQRRRNGRPPNARTMNVQLEDGESSISELVRAEVTRALQTPDINAHHSNFVEYEDFAGYAHGRKGYKVMDLEIENIHIARDVVFHERTFPFHHIDKSETLCPLPKITQNEEIEKLPNNEITEEIIENITPQYEQPIIPRRSGRQITRPTWMNDFVCNQTTDTYLPTNISLTHIHSCFVEGLSILQEPKNFSEAQARQEWREAMQQEINALERNETWEISDLPQGKNTIGCRWIYKVKLRPDGTVERCKARLVANGFSQVEGIDYNDCFSPVAKPVTVRLFLAIAAARGWPLHHLDVNNAFLHGKLDEIIYMDAPEGYKVPSGQVCRLKKSLYGLKQASRQWNQEFTDKIKAFGFTQSSHDYCLFVKGSGLQLIALLVYVDDILITAPTETLIQEVKRLGGLSTFQKITYGLLYILGGKSSLMETKKQTTVARSSAEAEYRSMTSTTCEITWITYLLQDLGVKIDTPVPFFCDNKAALHITANPVFHERTKHLEIDCHVVRDKYKEGLIQPTYVVSKQQVADIFTKPLPGVSFLHLCSKLGLVILHPRPTCGGAAKVEGVAEAE
ncbi:UNVERIFIED_CONTAM: Copia protein [Sesamum radiatum]|uniref:Copia protein n=1 Tax=Sesamum radiatum TaxID=300843 RepID=A0AAW2PIY2_SESRA